MTKRIAIERSVENKRDVENKQGVEKERVMATSYLPLRLAYRIRPSLIGSAPTTRFQQ